MVTQPGTALWIAQALIRIPSVNPNYDPSSEAEKDVADWIKSWGHQHGFETIVQPVLEGRSNIILRIRNGADSPHLMFNGHMDTVAVSGMTVPPFGGEISEQRLWGRGSADMKGPLACMLSTALELKKNPDSWHGTFTLACVVDEEYRFRGTLALMEQPDRYDFAVVGEPTELRVVRGCKGCMRFSLRAHGRTAHSSRPEQGSNAINAMALAILELNSFFQEFSKKQHNDFGPPTCSVGIIEGGSGVNIVPEFCTIQADVRLIPGQDGSELMRQIETTLRDRLKNVKGIEWRFEPPGIIDPGYEISPEHSLVKAACKVVGNAASEVVFYSCDASKIALKGVPCIIFGPGDIALAHTATESIPVAALEEGTRTYLSLAQRLMPPKRV